MSHYDTKPLYGTTRGKFMTASQIGYIRVSSKSQSTERQLDGIKLNKVFSEKVSGGSTGNRPELENCIEWARSGDTIHFHSIDRAARNLADLQVLVKRITSKGVAIKFHGSNPMTFEAGSNNPMNTFILQIFGAIAELEKSTINERQAEGIAVALKNGVKFGATRKLSDSQLKEIKKQIEAGASITTLAKTFEVSTRTIHRMIK